MLDLPPPTETAMKPRQLLLTCTYGQHSYRPLIPADPFRWTAAELAAWQEDLQRRGLFDAEIARSFERMLQRRAEHLDVEMTLYRREHVDAEVLAELPLALRAARRYSADPALPLISHALARSLRSCREERARATSAAATRLLAIGKTWAARRETVRMFADGIALRGGLEIRVQRDRLRVIRNADVLLDAPACDPQLPRLRRIVVLWHRLVRRAVAGELCHAVPVSYERTVDARLKWALPLAGTRASTQAYVLDNGRIMKRQVELLSRSEDEAAARLEMAARIMQFPDRYSTTLHERLGNAVDALGYGIFASLDVELPDDAQQLAALDDTARRFIRPVHEGRQAAWGEPAEAFDVYQDGTCGPEFIGRVPQLTTAIALERAHRREVTMRLRMGVAGTQIGYSLVGPAA